jgi:two-component system nitrogen regulation sensor histidine kinase GlnL
MGGSSTQTCTLLEISRTSQRQSLKELVPFGSPLLALIDQVRSSGSPVNEYKVDLGTPGSAATAVDLHAAPSRSVPGISS